MKSDMTIQDPPNSQIHLKLAFPEDVAKNLGVIVIKKMYISYYSRSAFCAVEHAC